MRGGEKNRQSTLSKAPASNSAPKSTGIPAAAFVPISVLILARGIASIYPESAFWGLNFPGFLPDWSLLLLTFLSAIVAVPRAADSILTGLDAAASFLFPTEKRKGLLVHAAIAIACGILFWRLFVPFPFLGDGVHVVRSLLRYNEAAGLSYGTLWNEPLTVLVLNTLIGIFAPGRAGAEVDVTGYSDVFMIVSYLLGALFVFFVLRMSKHAFPAVRERLMLSAAVFGSAGLLFYFGYIEFYAFLYLFGTLYLLAVLRDSSTRAFPMLSTLLLSLAAAFHLSALVFIPAHILLLWRYFAVRQGGAAPSASRMITAVAVFAAAAFVFYLWTNLSGGNSFFIPLSSESSGLTLLAPRHLLDVLNNLLLHAPVPVAMFVTFLLLHRRTIENDGFVVVAIAAVFWLLLCAAHSAIGRDWDVYALLGASLAVGAALAVTQFEEPRLRGWASVQLTVQPLLMVIPWIAVNASFIPSMDRYLALTEAYAKLLPPAVTAGHYETLRSAMHASGNAEGEAVMIARSMELSSDPYDFYKLTRLFESADGITPSMLGIAEAALSKILAYPDSIRDRMVGQGAHGMNQTLDDLYFNMTKAVVRLLPTERRAVWAASACTPLYLRGVRTFDIASYLGNRHFDAKNYGQSIEWFTKALRDTARTTPDRQRSYSSIYHGLGIAYAKANDAEKCLNAFRNAVSYPEANSVTWSDYGFACYTFTRFAESVPAFSQALRGDSSDANALYCLGKILLIDPARHSTGRALLAKFLTMERNTPRAADAKEIMDMPLDRLRATKF
jgi:tetratricopeptide (TPR) repeat protein